ncbi:MAG: diaminopimelate decarboxylase [Candidatus Acidiferrum sp.]|jgi:diaminopimelate decarboxylase
MSAHARVPPPVAAIIDPVKFTPHFTWQSHGEMRRYELYCENVCLAGVAEEFGTPSYIYSRAAIADAYGELHGGLRGVPHTLCFAVKSNGNLAILSRLAKLGSGFDIVSGGELDRLGQIGVAGKRIVFSGVGKAREEIREALQYRAGKRGSRAGILLFNVESEAELEVLVEEAGRAWRHGISAPAAAIRVNPDVAAGGHPHISTGRHDHKFGLDWSDARRLYLRHKNSKHLQWRGISMHIGSQIVALDPFRAAFGRLASYLKELRRQGIALQYLDIGGGLGTRYTDEKVPSRAKYAAMVARAAKPLGVHVLLEPGRSIIAAAGVLLTRVMYTKTNRGKKFLVVDAAMNDLMRPALYGATHPITRTWRTSGSDLHSSSRVDIVGPVCETGDCFLRDWPLGGEARPGEVLAIWAAGAYGMAQTSNYNARCRPPEVLVEGRRAKLIRRRESRADLLRHDVC